MSDMAVSAFRTDLEKLVDLRMKEAKILLDHQVWDGAYYLAGYAVEFALKVRIISDLMKSDGFPDLNFAKKFYQHELTALLALTKLKDEMTTDPSVSAHWEIAKDWSEQSRYQIGRTEKDAPGLYDAIEKGGGCRGSRRAGRRSIERRPPAH